MRNDLLRQADQLWPLIEKKVRALVIASGGAAAGVASVGEHDIGGALHKGVLRNDQAPQFLLTDGTRGLSGNLAVDTGATIDGIDISAHAADPNAHHAKLHGITDAANHSATGGLQYQIVGLPTAGTLGLLTPKSSPAANEIVKTDSGSGVTLVDVTVTSDLFVTGYLDFGTNTMYEDASYLQVAGSKAVKFSQNIGNANWTVYNAGGAQFGGNVDIISGGDLYVAGSGAYAGNTVLFADSSGGNVGIMRNPDSQFALDVAGPIRGTYLVGQHALQVKGVLLLAHYDGRLPYESNFTGEPNGHMGQVAGVNGSVVYRPGKFEKALQLGPAATNRCTNPSFETNTTGWTFNDSNASGSMARTAYNAFVGTYSLQLFNNNSGEDDYAAFSLAGLSANTAYTISAYAYVTDEFAGGATSNRGLFCYDSANSAGTQQATTITGSTNGTWVRHVVTVTMTSSPGSLVVRLYAPKGRVYWDAVQIEQSGGATGYADGDMPGHTWAGTTHGSNSSRTATAYLTYPTAGNVATLRGSIMAWVYPYSAYGAGYFWRITGTTTGNIILRTNGANLEAFWGTQQITATGVVTGNAWMHVAVTYDGTTLRLYVNGAEAANGAASGFSGIPANMFVGIADGTNGPLAALLDDFCTVDRALPAAEVRSIYESNAPIFAASSVYVFRATPKGLINGDDEGLWIRDTAGNPVLGIYGGEAATKSWAGFTLAAGDIVFGRNAVGSSAIWWDQSAGTFGFYGAGSGTAQVEIATDGKLTAGGGKVKLDSTGFHALNASAVATIDINEQGIYLGDGGARTTIGNWSSGNRIRAYNVGEVYEATPETYLDDSSVSRTLYPLVIRGIRQGNDAALIELAAVNTSNVGAFLRVGEGFRLKDYYGSPYNTNRVVHASATDIILESTNLQLRGLTTSAAAVGAYSGKIRIQIAGTNYYIPYYAS